MDRDEALVLLGRHVASDSLRTHCIATATILRGLADAFGEDADLWEVIGILHDIDYEAFGGDMNRHGIEGAALLRGEGLPEEVCLAVERHNHLLFAPYSERLDLSLQAADSISGFLIACARVKGGAITDVTPKTVKKKLKEKAFAAGCERERIAAVNSLMEAGEFYEIAIASLAARKDELGLR
ncbi:MAG: HDIG domain-containing protein [Methanofollis sp.]|uniref:HD domain-containing protein n=1 Tax=Methanofollis sp. TaxID=2052835 RepID=UPI00260227D9|nr:HD domain-containing protein [Methanofollis sp.]MDD4255425.1 HDIG domain-containing protein [Methanofollis sp.]